eukprot:9499134-Pyramimonas_sp.AAC.1
MTTEWERLERSFMVVPAVAYSTDTVQIQYSRRRQQPHLHDDDGVGAAGALVHGGAGGGAVALALLHGPEHVPRGGHHLAACVWHVPRPLPPRAQRQLDVQVRLVLVHTQQVPHLRVWKSHAFSITPRGYRSAERGDTEGKRRSSVDAREPRNPTKSEEYQRRLQGVLCSTRGAQTSETLVTDVVTQRERRQQGHARVCTSGAMRCA